MVDTEKTLKQRFPPLTIKRGDMISKMVLESWSPSLMPKSSRSSPIPQDSDLYNRFLIPELQNAKIDGKTICFTSVMLPPFEVNIEKNKLQSENNTLLIRLCGVVNDATDHLSLITYRKILLEKIGAIYANYKKNEALVILPNNTTHTQNTKYFVYIIQTPKGETLISQKFVITSWKFATKEQKSPHTKKEHPLIFGIIPVTHIINRIMAYHRNRDAMNAIETFLDKYEHDCNNMVASKRVKITQTDEDQDKDEKTGAEELEY